MGTPIEVQFKLRIRHDDSPGFDETVFDYENSDNYNSVGQPRINNTIYEPYHDQGADSLPYPQDESKYFVDAHEIYIAPANKGWLSVIGSAQSDRITCGSTDLCKFLG